MTGYDRIEDSEVTRSGFVKGAAALVGGLSALELAKSGVARAEPARASVTPKRGGVLQFAIGDANVKDTLDPGHSEDTNAFVLAGNIYELLVRSDENTWAWKPLLAQSLVPNRQLTKWTIKLRDGIKFHDGRPLTSKDVAFTLRRIVTESYGNDIYAQLFPSLGPGGIQIKDRLTVVLNLKRPDALIPIILARRQAVIVPSGFPTDTTDPKMAVGTGPFRVKSFKSGQGWELERNPNYWQKGQSALLDGVRAVVIGEQSTKLRSVVSGQSHLADGIDASLAHTINKSQAQIIRLRNGAYVNVVLDQSVAPFTDPRISTALKSTVDRQALLQTVQFGLGSVSHDIPVPRSDYFNPKNYVVKRDIALAKKLLADAGYPDGIDLELITSEVFAGFVDLAVAFASQAAAAGFRIKVTKWPPQTYWDQVWLEEADVSGLLDAHPSKFEACHDIFEGVAYQREQTQQPGAREADGTGCGDG